MSDKLTKALYDLDVMTRSEDGKTNRKIKKRKPTRQAEAARLVPKDVMKGLKNIDNLSKAILDVEELPSVGSQHAAGTTPNSMRRKQKYNDNTNLWDYGTRTSEKVQRGQALAQDQEYSSDKVDSDVADAVLTATNDWKFWDERHTIEKDLAKQCKDGTFNAYKAADMYGTLIGKAIKYASKTKKQTTPINNCTKVFVARKLVEDFKMQYDNDDSYYLKSLEEQMDIKKALGNLKDLTKGEGHGSSKEQKAGNSMNMVAGSKGKFKTKSGDSASSSKHASSDKPTAGGSADSTAGGKTVPKPASGGLESMPGEKHSKGTKGNDHPAIDPGKSGPTTGNSDATVKGQDKGKGGLRDNANEKKGGSQSMSEAQRNLQAEAVQGDIYTLTVKKATEGGTDTYESADMVFLMGKKEGNSLYGYAGDTLKEAITASSGQGDQAALKKIDVRDVESSKKQGNLYDFKKGLSKQIFRNGELVDAPEGEMNICTFSTSTDDMVAKSIHDQQFQENGTAVFDPANKQSIDYTHVYIDLLAKSIRGQDRATKIYDRLQKDRDNNPMLNKGLAVVQADPGYVEAILVSRLDSTTNEFVNIEDLKAKFT